MPPPTGTCKLIYLFENFHFLKNLCLCKIAKAQKQVPAMLLAHGYQLEVQLFDCYEDLRPVEKNVFTSQNSMTLVQEIISKTIYRLALRNID